MQHGQTAFKLILLFAFALLLIPRFAIADGSVERKDAAATAKAITDNEVTRLEEQLKEQLKELKAIQDKEKENLPLTDAEKKRKEKLLTEDIPQTKGQLDQARINSQQHQAAQTGASDHGNDPQGQQLQAKNASPNGEKEGGSKLPPGMPQSPQKGKDDGGGGGGDSGGDDKKDDAAKTEVSKATDSPKVPSTSDEVVKLDDSIAKKMAALDNSPTQQPATTSKGIDLDEQNKQFKATLDKIAENGKALAAARTPSPVTTSETTTTTHSANTAKSGGAANSVGTTVTASRSSRGIPVALASDSTSLSRGRRAVASARGVGDSWTGKSQAIPTSLASELRGIQPRVLGSTPSVRHTE